MSTVTSKINKALSQLFGYDPITKLKIHRIKNLEKIGTDYGGWVIPENFLGPSSICYLAGAGEDISFDTGIAEKYGCHVHIFDPTPKAIQHFEELKSTILKGERMPINNQHQVSYGLNREKLLLLHFHDIGLWESEDTVKFYEPKNPDHASHSILNIQQTDHYIEAKVDRISTIMKRLGHDRIDLLKIDIDGSEYKVIESILEDHLDIRVICVEYDEVFFALDRNFLSRIKASLLSLMKSGYAIVYGDEHCNYTLIKKDLLSSLNRIHDN